MSIETFEATTVEPEVKLYPGVIEETVNRALGMEALFHLELDGMEN